MEKNKEFLGGYKALRYSYLASTLAIFSYHVISGIWFLGILLSGATYFA